MFEKRWRNNRFFGRYQVFTPKDQRRRMTRLHTKHTIKPKKKIPEVTLSSNYKMLFYFFTILCILIIASVAYRIFSLYKNRSFTEKSFKILVVSDKVYLARLDSAENTLTFSRLEGLNPSAIPQDKLTASMLIRIPIDAIVYKHEPITNFSTDFLHPMDSITSLFSSRGISRVDMNGFDNAKFVFLSQLADRIERNLVWKASHASDSQSYDDELYSLYHNKSFITNNFSVEVVNASAISGIGSQLSQILKNDGFNVVSVRSSPPTSSSLTIYERSNYEALAHLRSYFHLPEVSGDKQPIVSVSIVIDEGMAKLLHAL